MDLAAGDAALKLGVEGSVPGSRSGSWSLAH